MKSVLLIGAGRFGKHIAIKLNELGHEVMVVDHDEERVESIMPYVTSGQIGDSTNPDFIDSLGVNNFDVCIVGIGNDFQSSLETTALLKEMGAPLVISRASRDVHAKFLLRNGADEVIYPEKQIATWAAIRYSADHILDYIELDEEHSIIEVEPLKSWIGKTVGEIDIRKKHNINIMALKKDGVLSPILKKSDILLPGLHNVENYMAAIAATMDLVSEKTVTEIARTFPGVEHRCEFVRELDGIKYYNSSIDSTPTRTAAALSSFSQKTIVIIGGRDKHLDLAPLAKTLCDKAKAVILTGESINIVKDALVSYPGYAESGLNVITKEDFEEAVNYSRIIAEPGDTVILSPAFTSFDRFNNFEERGRLFKKTVNDFDK